MGKLVNTWKKTFQSKGENKQIIEYYGHLCTFAFLIKVHLL